MEITTELCQEITKLAGDLSPGEKTVIAFTMQRALNPLPHDRSIQIFKNDLVYDWAQQNWVKHEP
jgi:hypothetical protein